MFERENRPGEANGGASSQGDIVPGRSTLSQQLAAPAQHETRPEVGKVAAPERRVLEASASADAGALPEGSAASRTVPAAGGFSISQLFPGAGARKALDRDGDASGFGPPRKNGPDGGGTGSGAEPQQAAPPAKKKKAGVESFTVDWAKGTIIDPTAAKLRLDYNAKFKKDNDHDPALAEFRQNAGDKWEITDGPHKGAKGASPLADDNYSRADDLHGNKKTDQLFYSNDNPGWGIGQLDKDDVLDYEFTAEQMIIDTSDGNKVIAKRGPHTATIKGKSPRVHGNVPKKLG